MSIRSQHMWVTLVLFDPDKYQICMVDFLTVVAEACKCDLWTLWSPSLLRESLKKKLKCGQAERRTLHLAPSGAKNEQAFSGVIWKSERPSGPLCTRSGPPFLLLSTKLRPWVRSCPLLHTQALMFWLFGTNIEALSPLMPSSSHSGPHIFTFWHKKRGPESCREIQHPVEKDWECWAVEWQTEGLYTVISDKKSMSLAHFSFHKKVKHFRMISLHSYSQIPQLHVDPEVGREFKFLFTYTAIECISLRGTPSSINDFTRCK